VNDYTSVHSLVGSPSAGYLKYFKELGRDPGRRIIHGLTHRVCPESGCFCYKLFSLTIPLPASVLLHCQGIFASTCIYEKGHIHGFRHAICFGAHYEVSSGVSLVQFLHSHVRSPSRPLGSVSVLDAVYRSLCKCEFQDLANSSNRSSPCLSGSFGRLRCCILGLSFLPQTLSSEIL
jgi:hypothetical protein